MDASGVIFVMLVVVGLFYFVPRQLSWRIPTQADIEEAAPQHVATKTVHTGQPVKPADPGKPVDPEAEEAAVSTLLIRRAGRRLAQRRARQAERRRRLVLVVLLGTCLATIPFVIMGWWMSWWVPLAGLGGVLAWVIFSHFEARRVTRALAAILADTELGDDEKTVAVQLLPPVEPSAKSQTGIVGPNGDVQLSLWEPITVVPATYISAPTAARTVRTIDLTAPIATPPWMPEWPEESEDSEDLAL